VRVFFIVTAIMLSASAAPADWRSGTGDPVLLSEAKSLLTSLQYYLGPQPGETESATLSRAFTNWLFHHDLPASVSVTPEVIEKMEADLTAGDLFPMVNTPIGSTTAQEAERSSDEPAAQAVPERDVDGYCKKMFPRSTQLSSVCTRQERHAYDRLRDQWPSIAQQTRELCGQAFGEDYQLLLVCINLEPEAGVSTPSSKN
jgi:hypothetical protein